MMKYKIMHRDSVIAEANGFEVTEILNPALCPSCFYKGYSLERWLKSRQINLHRVGERMLYKALYMKPTSSIEDVIAISHSVVLTDNWWIQSEFENLHYFDLRQYNKNIADIACTSNLDFSSLPYPIKGYLEFGTTGCFEKAWRLENGVWWLHKKEDFMEVFREFYAYCFLKALDFPVAEYQILSRVSKCTGEAILSIRTRDFTNHAEMDFEPFFNQFGEEYNLSFILSKLTDSLAESYVMTLFYDMLLFHRKRDNADVGVLRNRRTGEPVRLAPSFDFNQALIGSWLPEIATYMKETAQTLLNNEKALEIMKRNAPNRTSIAYAANYAEKCVKQHMADAFNEMFFPWVNNQVLQMAEFLLSWLEKS